MAVGPPYLEVTKLPRGIARAATPPVHSPSFSLSVCLRPLQHFPPKGIVVGIGFSAPQEVELSGKGRWVKAQATVFCCLFMTFECLVERGRVPKWIKREGRCAFRDSGHSPLTAWSTSVPLISDQVKERGVQLSGPLCATQRKMTKQVEVATFFRAVYLIEMSRKKMSLEKRNSGYIPLLAHFSTFLQEHTSQREKVRCVSNCFF